MVRGQFSDIYEPYYGSSAISTYETSAYNHSNWFLIRGEVHLIHKMSTVYIIDKRRIGDCIFFRQQNW